MANLIIISGPQAVGKMTVAESLKEKIGYRVFTNHDSIEYCIKVFGNKKTNWVELNNKLREDTFSYAIKNNVNLIFTFVCAYDMKEDIDYLNKLKSMFTMSGGNFYFVELYADIETRLKRNVTPHRLESKKSKQDTEWSNNELIETSNKYRLSSNKDEYIFDTHYKIDNTNLEPDEVSDMIIKHFDLKENNND